MITLIIVGLSVSQPIASIFHIPSAYFHFFPICLFYPLQPLHDVFVDCPRVVGIVFADVEIPYLGLLPLADDLEDSSSEGDALLYSFQKLVWVLKEDEQALQGIQL